MYARSVTRGIVVCASALVLLFASRADAAPRHRLSGHNGLGAPNGYFGIAYAYAPGSGPFSVETGLGVGVTGLLVSVMPTIRFSDEPNRFFVGAGVSWAVIKNNCQARLCGWLNVDLLGYEHTDGRYSFVVAAGLHAPLQRVTIISSGKALNLAMDPLVPAPNVRLAWGGYLDGGPADESRPSAPAPTRHHRVGLEVGAAEPGPFTRVNISYAIAPLSWLRFKLEQSFAFPGALTSVMPQLSIGWPRDRFVIGAGVGYFYAHGRRFCEDKACAVFVADLLGYEHTFDLGLTLFARAGFVATLQRYNQSPPEWPANPAVQSGPSLGTGLGWWF
jgi:hypothetical protein